MCHETEPPPVITADGRREVPRMSYCREGVLGSVVCLMDGRWGLEWGQVKGGPDKEEDTEGGALWVKGKDRLVCGKGRRGHQVEGKEKTVGGRKGEDSGWKWRMEWKRRMADERKDDRTD